MQKSADHADRGGLSLVPATPTLSGSVEKFGEKFARVVTAAPMRRALAVGMVSSHG